MDDTHTISMAASELGWDDVDTRAKQIGFKDRSKYIQFLVERDIHKGKYDKIKDLYIFEIIVLIFLSMITVLLIEM